MTSRKETKADQNPNPENENENEDPLANEIIIKQKKVLSLVRAGYTNLVFPNVLSIEQKLKEEISNNNVEIASDIH